MPPTFTLVQHDALSRGLDAPCSGSSNRLRTFDGDGGAVDGTTTLGC